MIICAGESLIDMVSFAIEKGEVQYEIRVYWWNLSVIFDSLPEKLGKINPGVVTLKQSGHLNHI